MSRTIDELDKFNDMIVNSGLNSRLQEFLVAINNCGEDPFEGLAYAISQQDFEKKQGNFENRIQVYRPIANNEFEFCDIKLDEEGNIIVKITETTDGGILSKNCLSTKIVVDKDGNGKIFPQNPRKDVRVTTFRLEKERIVDIDEEMNLRPYELGHLVNTVLYMLDESKNEQLHAFVRNLKNYDPEKGQDLSTGERNITKFSRLLSDGWKEETNVVEDIEGVSFQINEYNNRKLYSTEIEVKLDQTDDFSRKSLNGEVVVSTHTYEGTQTYSKNSEERFVIKNGEILPNEKTEEDRYYGGDDGEGK